MTSFIEAVEDRRLFSAVYATIVADETALKADAKVLVADLHNCAVAYAALVKTANTAMKGQPLSATNRHLLQRLKSDQVSCTSILKSDYAHLLNANKPILSKLAADAFTAYTYPNNARVQNRLMTDLAKAIAVSTAPLDQMHADIDTCNVILNQDVSVICSANPTMTQLPTVFTAAQAADTSAGNTLQNDLYQSSGDTDALTSDVATWAPWKTY